MCMYERSKGGTSARLQARLLLATDSAQFWSTASPRKHLLPQDAWCKGVAYVGCMAGSYLCAGSLLQALLPTPELLRELHATVTVRALQRWPPCGAGPGMEGPKPYALSKPKMAMVARSFPCSCRIRQLGCT